MLDYFVVVVGNETKCAALGDAAYAAAIECLGGFFIRCIQSNFWGRGEVRRHCVIYPKPRKI